MAITVNQVADVMFKLVSDAQGKKKLKAMDLTKAVMQLYPEADKQMCKDAIRQLMESGRCIYTYFGGSYVELPHKESAANE